MDVIVQGCAGIDVHKDTVVTCVRTPGADGHRELVIKMSAVIENCTLAVTRIAYGRPSLLHTLPQVAVTGFCG